MLDEAQRLPETARIVKGWHDAKVPTRILLLGSSSLDLLDQSAESLTGRNRKLVLPPLLFANALLNAFTADEFRPDIGAVWENWVIAEFAKSNALLGLPCELFFWRSRTQAEVDLVVKAETGLRAFEIKWRPRRLWGECRAPRSR